MNIIANLMALIISIIVWVFLQPMYLLMLGLTNMIKKLYIYIKVKGWFR